LHFEIKKIKLLCLKFHSASYWMAKKDFGQLKRPHVTTTEILLEAGKKG